MLDTDPLPSLALSVRQPSAWAILHGGKDIENRSFGSVRAGRMTPGLICLHAAVGLKEDEYRYIAWRMQEIGVICPPPAQMVRGAIIGTVEVVDIVDKSDSRWYGGAAGLVLENPQPLAHPIPAKGKLGYFEWQTEGQLAPPLPWMSKYERSGLFDDLPLTFAEPPKRPWPKLGSERRQKGLDG